MNAATNHRLTRKWGPAPPAQGARAEQCRPEDARGSRALLFDSALRDVLQHARRLSLRAHQGACGQPCGARGAQEQAAARTMKAAQSLRPSYLGGRRLEFVRPSPRIAPAGAHILSAE